MNKGDGNQRNSLGNGKQGQLNHRKKERTCSRLDSKAYIVYR